MSAAEHGGREVGDPTPDQRQARFRALYDETLPRVFRFVSRALAPDPTDVDDVVAEVYIVAWRRIDDLPSAPDDRLWLFGVARNVVAHQRRSAALRLRLSARLDREPTHQLADIEVHDDVLAAVQHLPRRELEAFHLVVWEGLSNEDAAKIIGCSANAVRIRVHRARRRLAQRLPIKEPSVDRDLPAPALSWELPQ